MEHYFTFSLLLILVTCLFLPMALGKIITYIFLGTFSQAILGKMETDFRKNMKPKFFILTLLRTFPKS